MVAAVVLVAGFALADALRSRGGDTAQETSPTVGEERDRTAPQPTVSSEWPTGRLRGKLVFTNAGDCRVRVIGLDDGQERPSGRFQGSCRLWAPSVGERIAYGVRGGRSELSQRWFSIVDLTEPDRDLGTFKNLVGDVLWSPDAQRLAWCVFGGEGGRELEIGGARPRRVSGCPLAYDPSGRLVFARGMRLVSEEGQILLVADGRIVQAHWGEDGSLLVVLADGTVRRYDFEGRIDELTLVADREIVPSPDNCAVLFPQLDRIQILDVGCYDGPAESFLARDAAWSPDGRWVATADEAQIRFEEVGDGDEVFVWPARAIELYWRED
jgi:hypothetical protein